MGEFTIKDSLVSFESPAVTDVTSAKVYFEPVQEGEDNPSPENVRNITGWTGAELHRCGKNIFSGKQIVELLYGSNYTVYEDEYGKYIYIGSTSIINVPNNIFKENTRYTFIMKIYDESINNTLCFQIHYTDGSATNISAPRDALKVAVTTSANKTVQGIHGLLRTAKRRFYFEESGVFEGVVPIAAYEPYKGPILPSEYQEVEYLECTGTQWIDTGRNLYEGSIISIDFYITESSVNRVLYGWRRKGTYKQQYQLMIGANQSKRRYIAYGASSEVLGSDFDFDTINKVIIDSYNKHIYINGEIVNCRENFGSDRVFNTDGSSELNPYLFTFNSIGSASSAMATDIKIYKYSVKYNGNLIQNFIPCYRKSDNEPGMYDTVSGTFFTNQGTGEFIVGSNVYYDTIPVSWETEAGTAYGGYVDLVKGEVVEEYQKVVLNGSSGGSSGSNYNGTLGTNRYFSIPRTGVTYVEAFDAWGDKAKKVNGSGKAIWGNPNNYIWDFTINASTQLHVVFDNETLGIASDTSAADRTTIIKNWLTEHPMTFVVPLETQITHQLTPETIETLKGINNFWGNTNADTEITYEVADALKMTQIRKNILMTQPHIESATAANPLTFQTDISASIKGGKVYFSPVQEGEGDPSPDNVRVISGWDGIDIYHYGANLFPLTLPSTAFKGTFGTGSSSIGSATNGRVWTMYVGENQNLYYQHGSISPTVLFAFSDKPLTTRTDAVIYNALNCTSRNNVLLNSTTHPYLVIAIANSTMLVPETGTLDNASAMLSFGNTRKSYEKRTDPKLITLPFPKTIYGGYVDLTNGEVVETWKNYDYPVNPNVFTDLENGYYEVGFGEVNGKGYGSSANSVCSVLTYGYSKTPTIKTGYTLDYVLNSKSNRFHSVIYSETPITQNTARQWFIDNNVQLVREMYTSTTHQLADGLTHITLGQDISPRPNGRSSTGGYANSTATGSDGCKFVYFELGWPTEEFLQYSADISRRSEFVSDSKVLINGTTTDAKLGEMVISTGSATDYDGDALVYMYISVPSDCTDLETKRAYLAEHPIKITYPKKTLIPYTIDLTDLKPVKGTNNIWSNANNNIEIKFWKH